jgi:alkylhydroperoxidase family enzyme
MRAPPAKPNKPFTLNAWAETPFFSDRERAAVAWTDSVTDVAQTPVPDEVLEEVKRHFSERGIVEPMLAVATIKLWNRVSISLRAVPGHYRPAETSAAS